MLGSESGASRLAMVAVCTMGACSKSDPGPVITASNNSSSTTASTAAKSGSNGGDSSSTTTAGGSGDKSGDNSGGNSGGNPTTGLGTCYDAAVAYATITGETMALQSPTATQAEKDKLKADIEKFKGEVPDEIKDDVATYVKALGDYSQKMAELPAGGVASGDYLQKLEEAAKILDDPDFKKASDNIDAYFKKNCASPGQ